MYLNKLGPAAADVKAEKVRMFCLGKELKDDDATLEAAYEVTRDLRWVPNPGPQTDAYFSEADELLFGGERTTARGRATEENVVCTSG
jgi:hypothetical protein